MEEKLMYLSSPKRKSVAYASFALLFLLSTDAYAEMCVGGSSRTALREVIAKEVALINAIVQDPRLATMQNWLKIGNPHDETEISFFANSISDGTEGVYSKGPIQQKIVEHTKRPKDKSVVLEFMRLAVLSTLSRPPSVPAQFTQLENKWLDVVSIQKTQEVTVNAILDSDHAGTRRPSKITFDVYQKPTSAHGDTEMCVNLRTLEVDRSVVYGWWYDK